MRPGGYFKTNYLDDLAIFDTLLRRSVLVIGIIAAIIFPLIASDYASYIANTILIACIVTLGLNLAVGYAGLLSLGHAGLACTGAFTAGILATRWGAPFVVVLPTAALVGALFGFIGGLPALKLRGLYFIVGTLALHYIIIFLATQYQYIGGYVAGGIPIPQATLGPVSLDNNLKWFYFLAVVVAVVTAFCINLERSKVGRALKAIRDRDIAAEVFGINAGLYKVVAFTLSGGITGLTGALQAYFNGFTNVETFSLWLSITYLTMLIVGGMGSILGAFLGATLISLVPHVLDWLFDLFPIASSYIKYTFNAQVMLFGLLLVIFVMIEPRGLVTVWVRVRNFFELWPFKHSRRF